MTTICYKDGMLAADRLVTMNGIVCGTSDKIMRSPFGHLFGAAGDVDSVETFKAWVNGGCVDDPPSIDKADSVAAILIFPDGRVRTWYGSPVLVNIDAKFHALGSGCEIAIGAMAMGADARQALEIASQYDTRSGGGIDVLRLGDG